jgi:hypothetical protein
MSPALVPHRGLIGRSRSDKLRLRGSNLQTILVLARAGLSSLADPRTSSPGSTSLGVEGSAAANGCSRRIAPPPQCVPCRSLCLPQTQHEPGFATSPGRCCCFLWAFASRGDKRLLHVSPTAPVASILDSQ